MKRSAPAARCGPSSARRSSSAADAVADLELQRLADLDVVADRDRADVGVGAQHVADEEVTAGEVGLVLVDDQPDREALAQQVAFGLVGGRGELLESLEGGLAAELDDQVAVGAGDRERPARLVGSPWETTAVDVDAVEGDPDRAVAADVVVEHEPVPARVGRRGGHPADDGEPGPLLVQAAQERVGREA